MTRQATRRERFVAHETPKQMALIADAAVMSGRAIAEFPMESARDEAR